ncbi:apolipoprotein N-acyltransferase [Jatrophihabitans fulvus]
MRPVPAPVLTRRWAALVAVGGGLLGVLAFPSFGVWPAAFGSVAALSVAVSGHRCRTAAWLGYVYGLAFMLPLVHWTGIYVGPVPWLLLCAALAGFFAVLGAVLPLLARLPGAPLWAGSAWVLQEFLRDRIPFGGFPWGRLAFSQAESPLRWFASWGGAPLLSFVVAVAGAALAQAVLAVSRRDRSWVRVAVVGVVVALALPLLGWLVSFPVRPGADADGRTLRIAVIQGGLPDRGLQFQDRARQVLDNHVRQTLKLAARIDAGQVQRPDLVLWPENSSDIDPYRDAAARAEIDGAVKAVGAPVLVGAILQGPGTGHRRNAGILWSPTTGPGARYVKRHPVPFAEYIPLRPLAEAVSSDAKNVTDMVAGGGNGLLTGGPVPLGDVICFEVAYDGLVRSSVAAGAQLLIVQTNNATFGRTDETYQQLAMSQLRAVENGRATVQVSTTGESAVIGPDGRIRERSGELFTPDILIATVPVRTALTPATRVGAWPEYLLTLLALGGAAGVVVAGRRRRVDPPNTPAAEPEMVKV